MSPESCAERGVGAHNSTTSSAQDGQKKETPSGWAKFANTKKNSNDPRSIAHARFVDHGLAIWPVSVPAMNLILGHLYQRSAEVEKKVLDCAEPGSEEWRSLMDELDKRLQTLWEKYLLASQVLALSKPTRAAVESAACVLTKFDREQQFPFGHEPNGYRHLEKLDEVHRLLRLLLNNKKTRIFLPWMPVGPDGDVDARWLSATSVAIKDVCMGLLCLGPFGLALFKGVSDTWIKIVLFIAAVVGVMAMLAADGTTKHAFVLMAVMAGVVFGGRDAP